MLMKHRAVGRIDFAAWGDILWVFVGIGLVIIAVGYGLHSAFFNNPVDRDSTTIYLDGRKAKSGGCGFILVLLGVVLILITLLCTFGPRAIDYINK